MRKATIVLREIKDSDGWGELAHALGLSRKMKDEHFEYGEFASLELTFDENLRVVEGRVIPLAEKKTR